jgi:hypothetical protein
MSAWLSRRLSETSTHVGLNVLSTALTAYLSGGKQAAIAAACSAVFSILYPQSGAK